MLVTNESNLREILTNVSENLPIAIITIVGNNRKYNFILLNMLIHILNYYEENMSLSGYNENELNFNLDYNNYFYLNGINMYSKPFYISNPLHSLNMAVLLVECDNLEIDNVRDINEELFITLNLISSMLIINAKELICESDLMTILSEKCNLIREERNDKKCSLEYLIRDCEFDSEEYNKKTINNKINNYYSHLNIFGLPYAGEEIEKDDFDGNNDKILPKFKKNTIKYYSLYNSYLKELINRLIPTFNNNIYLFKLCNNIFNKNIKPTNNLYSIHNERIKNDIINV